MPNWIPMSIGLQGMLDQLSSGTPSPAPSAPGSLPPGWVGPPPGDYGGGFDIGSLFAPSSTADQQAQARAIASYYGVQGGGGGAEPDLSSLFAGDPTTQLAQAIAKRAGVPLNPGRMRDPRHLADLRQIMDMARRAQTDGNLRQELAVYLGWNPQNLHVQFWLQNGGGLPSDPTGTGLAPGQKATTATGSGAPGSGTAPADPSAAKVQAPWDSKYSNWNYGGNNYGDPKPPGVDWGGWTWHRGQDYSLPQGTPLSFPFYGKVVKTGYEPNGYGSYVTIEFGNGFKLTYAHLSSIGVREGDTVQPGQQVALSGGDQPGGGISTGHHLLVVETDAQNRPLDPRPLIQAAFSGQTLAALQQSGLAATGAVAPAGASLGYEITPDGQQLFAGTPDRQMYDLVNSAYKQLYGVDAPFSLVMAMRAEGVTNADQMKAITANWPSDIPGVSFGQRENIMNTASTLAQKQWNRPVPDSLIKRLAQNGLTSPAEIQWWFDTHVPSDMPAADYQQIYDAAAPQITNAYGESPSPDYIGYLWGQTQAQSQTTTAPTGVQTNAPSQTPTTTGGSLPTVPGPVP